MKRQWHAAWQAQDIVVTLGGREIDRIDGRDIRRVIFVENRQMRTASDHAFAIVDLGDEQIVFPSDSGLAGLVHFERQSFWHRRPCVYWLPPEAAARLPARCRARRWWLLRRGAPIYSRVARAELAEVLDGPVAPEGPQCWEERRWQHIQDRQSMFAPMSIFGSVANDQGLTSFGSLNRHRA